MEQNAKNILITLYFGWRILILVKHTNEDLIYSSPKEQVSCVEDGEKKFK